MEPAVQCHIHNSPSLYPMQSQMNSLHTLTPSSHLCLGLPGCFFISILRLSDCILVSSRHMSYKSNPSHLYWKLGKFATCQILRRRGLPAGAESPRKRIVSLLIVRNCLFNILFAAALYSPAATCGRWQESTENGFQYWNCVEIECRLLCKPPSHKQMYKLHSFLSVSMRRNNLSIVLP
jgi:hypothetical protein